MEGIGSDILEVLRGLGIKDERGLAEKYGQWGVARIESLLIALSEIDDRPISRTAALSIAPVGGCLGLGRAEEFLRQLLLYSDRVIVYDEIRTHAAESLRQRREKPWKVPDAKEHFALVYPFLHQLLWARSAVNEGMLVIGPSALRPFDSPAPSPLVDAVLANAPSDYARFAALSNGEGYAAFGRGEREVVVFGGLMASGMSIRVGSPPTSIVPMASTFSLPQGPSVSLSRQDFEERFPEEWLRFVELVSGEIARMGQALELTAVTGASLLSDQDDDRQVFQSLLSGAAGGYRGAEVDAFEISDSLDFLQGVSPDSLVRLRLDLELEFDKFRAAFVALGAALRAETGDARRRAAERIVRDEIRPALADLGQRMIREREERFKAAGVVVATAILSLTAAALTGNGLATLADVAALPALTRAIEDRSNTRLDPYLFLYRVKESSPQS